MKKLIFLFFSLITLSVLGQNKDAINYQSVIRNENGIILNQLVNIRLSILQSTAVGSVVYSETHLVTSNDYGIISLQIGNGTVESGSYNSVNWGGNNHFLKIEIDENGGNNFVFMGTNQFLSVPYALSAKTAENVDDADADNQNEIQTLSQFGNDVTLSLNGGSISVADSDNDSINEIQTLELVGNELKISKGNSITLSGTVDLDGDPTNELQNLTLSNDSVLISNGTGLKLPPTGDIDSTNEFQNLSLVGDSILISNGQGIQLSDNDSLNELQLLSISNDTVFLEKGGFVKLPVSLDNDSTNELQVLSRSMDTLRLSNGNYVILPENLDNDSTNEIQTLSYEDDSLKISNGNSLSLDFLEVQPKKYSIGIDSSLGGYVFKLSSDSLHGIVCTLDFDSISTFKYADAFDAITDTSNYYGLGKKFVDWELPNKLQLFELLEKVDVPDKNVREFLSSSFGYRYTNGGFERVSIRTGVLVRWNPNSFPEFMGISNNQLWVNTYSIIPIRKF